MIQLRSLVKVTDNSGAKEVRVINVFGQPSATGGELGDIIIGSVQKRLPNSEIAKGAKVRGVIVRTRGGYHREDGSVIRFDDNAIVLVTPDLQPVGTRIFGPVPRELREKQMLRILSLAPEVL
jgi:large subunit ribosomal protein L14